MWIINSVLAALWMLTAAAAPANLTLFGKHFGFAQSCIRDKGESYACYERSTDRWWLRAVCFRPDGSTRCSRFNLNTAIVNTGGYLEERPFGMFSKTCRDCALVADISGRPINLGCHCDPGNRFTYLEIDRFINNDHGRLRYQDTWAEDCTEQFQCEQTPGDETPA